MLAAIFATQHLNHQCGGAVVAPWEIEPGHTLDEWADAAMMLSQRGKRKQRQSGVDDYLRKRRANAKVNPHYAEMHKGN